MPRTVLMAVQIEGPRFSTRISVGERPSEKTPFCFGRVTGMSFETRTALGEAFDAIGLAWDAFRTARVGNWTRFVCRQRCMNSSALLGVAMVLPFMTGHVYRDREPWSIISVFTCSPLQANLATKLVLPRQWSGASACRNLGHRMEMRITLLMIREDVPSP